MERHFYSLYLMKFNSLAKRTFLLISLSCLTTPAIAECSKDEYEFQFGTLKSIFTEIIDLSVQFEAGKKAAKSNSSEYNTKSCQIVRRVNQLNRAYLSVDTAFEKSCPRNYEKHRSAFKNYRDTCIKNKSLLQNDVDICTKRGF